jgi:hypothetical protein
MLAQRRSGQQELLIRPAWFLKALLTDDGANDAPDRAQMPNCAKGATAERRLAVAPFAPLGLPRPYLVAPLLVRAVRQRRRPCCARPMCIENSTSPYMAAGDGPGVIRPSRAF